VQLNAQAHNAAGAAVPGTFAYTPNPGSVLPVGTHTMQVLFIPDDAEAYGSQMKIAQITVEPAPLTVQAADAASVYGRATVFSGTEFTVSGLVSPDSVTGVTLASDGASGAAAGSFPIVASAAAGTGLTNYTIGYLRGTLTVDRAPLTIMTVHQTKLLGAVDPPLTFLASGFQLGDTAATALSGTLSRAPGEAIGTYPILQGTLTASANYTIGFTGNTLEVTAPPQVNPIVNPGNQTSSEGAEVELVIRLAQTAGSSRKHGDDDRNDRTAGVFSAANLPSGLDIEKEKGVIRGHVKKNSAGEYQVTVFYRLAGVTSSQSFTWTIVKQDGRKEGK
jgi:hypothetical protein